jgi:nucleoside phosphorylase
MTSTKYNETAFTIISEKFGQNFILLVTATGKETEHLHKHLRSIDSSGAIYKVYKNSLCYFVGVLGNYNVVHVQSGMGATSRDASIITIGNTINDIQPKVVIMVGIAFGVNRKKQKIGDILVSETILPYEFSRVGDDTIRRTPPAYANKILVSRYKNLQGWEHILPNRKKANVIIANILSGEKLIDKIEFRNELIKDYPLAHGGEMEGAGLFTACDGKAEWILIKGICDFADGNKRVNKDRNQSVAVEAAIATLKFLFDSKFTFDGLDIKPTSESNDSLHIIKHNFLEKDQAIQLPTPPEIINKIVEEIIDDSNTSSNMLKQVQELVRAFLSLTEVDKLRIAQKLNLDSANMIEIPGHTRDKVIFSEVKSKNLLAELWDEVFKNSKINNNQNPFK